MRIEEKGIKMNVSKLPLLTSRKIFVQIKLALKSLHIKLIFFPKTYLTRITESATKFHNIRNVYTNISERPKARSTSQSESEFEYDR